MNKPILVELSRMKTADNKEQLVPKVTLGDFASQGFSQPDMRSQLNAFAARYQEMIDQCRTRLDSVSQQKAQKAKVDPLLFWEIGNYILRYLQDERLRGEFALNDIYGHLSRDLPLSTSSLEKILTFRRRFASKDLVDSSKGWTYYRDATYQKPVSASKLSERKRSVIAMLRLKVPRDMSLEDLDSRLQQGIQGQRGVAQSFAELLRNGGIEFDTYEVLYGKDTRSDKLEKARNTES